MTLRREGRQEGFKELSVFGQGGSLNYSADDLGASGNGTWAIGAKIPVRESRRRKDLLVREDLTTLLLGRRFIRKGAS